MTADRARVARAPAVVAPKREVVRFRKDEIDRFVERMFARGIVRQRFDARSTRLVATARRRLAPQRVWVRTRSRASTNELASWLTVTR